MFAEPTVGDARVCVRYAAQQSEGKYEEGKLHRGYPDGQPYGDEPHISDRVLQNMRPVIGPERHLLFGMM